MKHVQENKIIGEGISMLKKFVVLPTLALTFAVGTTACKEKDIAVVGGAIAIVAGAVAIGAVLDSNDHAHRPQCRGGYVEQCRSTYDRWGRRHTSCRREWDPCATRYSATLASPLSGTDLSVATVAGKYNLPKESAERLTKVLQAAHSGQNDALASLGLTQSDLVLMTQFQKPSIEGVEKMAASLALSQKATEDLIQALMNDARLQFADIESPVWQACTSAGEWQTPENSSCRETHWSGCSPETGASLCAVSR